jgi:DeoR/GlpR family transcriptional regulator of sugar metabolism
MLGSSKRTAILCISEKLNISLRLKVSGLENINYLVTELPKDEKYLAGYQLKSLEIL